MSENERIQTKLLTSQITPVVQRQVEADEDEEEPIQTKQDTGQPQTVSPALANRIHSLKGGGQPLPKSVRNFFEPRFGVDFGGVRIHSNSQSAKTAEGLNAQAFTFGNNLVFGKEQYNPETNNGRLLIAHELVHTIQQNKINSNPHSTNALSKNHVSYNEFVSLTVPQLTVDTPIISMRGPMVRPPVRPAVEPSTRPGVRTPDSPRYAVPPTTLEEMLEQTRQINKRKQDVFEAERPIATIERGGRPPDFITVEREQEGMWEWGNATYRVRRFHILDAIEHAVGRATSQEELNQILLNYIQFPIVDRYSRLITSPFSIYGFPIIPPNLDPDGTTRLQVYLETLERRTRQIPGLSSIRTTPARIPEETRRRGCVVRPARPAGEVLDPLAPIYCQIMTGTPFEYRITSPEGETVQYDAMLGSTVYECKCGYGSIIRDLNAEEEWRRRRAESSLQKRDEQMLRQRRVAIACGLRLIYYVSNRELADLLNERWFSNPIVEWRPWSECDRY